MKYILSFLLISFLTISVSAQKENTAFLEKKMIEWLDNEVNDFSEAITTAETAHQKNDKGLVSNSKSTLIKGLKRFSNNCGIIYDQIAADRVELAVNTQKNDYIEGQLAYVRKKSQSRLQEISVDAAGEKQLRTDVDKIISVYENIQKRDLDFHPTEKNTEANLRDAKQIMELAQNINQMLQSAIISE